MFAGGGDFLGVLPYLSWIFRVLGEKCGKAQDGVHRCTDIMGHIGEEGGLGIAGNLGGPQGFSQLAVVQLPFCLPFLANSGLLSLIEVVQNTTE